MPRWGACGGRGPKCRGWARERPSHTHWGEHGGWALGPEGPAAQPGALYLVPVIREGGRRREPGGAEDAGGRQQAAGGRRRRGGRRLAEQEGVDCGRICRGKILRLASPRLLNAASHRPPPAPGRAGLREPRAPTGHRAPPPPRPLTPPPAPSLRLSLTLSFPSCS